MEAMGLSADFWRGKRVLVTGHTGFKGSWLTLWLQSLGARSAAFRWIRPPNRTCMNWRECMKASTISAATA
jgi:GDP-D-mannose dehydratase